jgi:hypothetical protein
MPMSLKEIREQATLLAEAQDADVFFYNGDIDPRWEAEFVKLGNPSRRRQNVILALCTRRGKRAVQDRPTAKRAGVRHDFGVHCTCTGQAHG